MKKILFVFPIVALLAAGCNSSQQPSSQQNTQTQQQANQTPPANPTQTQLANGDTESWKTYTNAKYGFEVKYPETWQIVNNQDTGASIADPTNPDKVRMSVYASASDPEQKTRDVDQITGSTIYDLQGISGKKLTGESGVTGGDVTILIVKKLNTYYEIEASPEMFDKVISTFKFSNPASENQNSNTKTYNNTQYGFTFNYPSTYTLKTSNTTAVPGEQFAINITGSASGPASFMSVSVWNNSKQLSLLDWATANSSFSNYSSGSLNTNFKNETLAGHQAISYSWVGKGDGKTVAIANNQTILLLDTGANSKTDQIWQDFDGVLSSLKFTK